MAAVWTLALIVVPTITREVDGELGLSPLGGFVVPIGVSLFGAASALGVASAWVMATVGHGTPIPFDAARELVVEGPYRLVRNPMAIAGVGQALGVALWTRSLSTLAIPLAGALVWQLLLRPPEERFLTERFGSSYLAYQREVRCWLPVCRSCRSRHPVASPWLSS
jgi:protein-S-isoprenylcysteine O-methyltransferase Ste14